MKSARYIAIAVLAVCVLLFKYHGLYMENVNDSYTFPVSGVQTVTILTYGDGVSRGDIRFAQKVLREVFDVNTRVVQRPIKELHAFYNHERRAYDAAWYLRYVEAQKRLRASFKNIAIVNQDLFGADGTKVIGESTRLGKGAILTTKGYVLTIRGISVEPVLHRRVLRPLLIHQMGHLLGLEDCRNHCVMRPENDVSASLGKHMRFCGECEKRLLWLSETRFQKRRLPSIGAIE